MEISGDTYAWLVVFVLPLNSAVNPLLYTFSTPKYRDQIYTTFSKQSFTKKNDSTSNQGSDLGTPVLNDTNKLFFYIFKYSHCRWRVSDENNAIAQHIKKLNAFVVVGEEILKKFKGIKISTNI